MTTPFSVDSVKELEKEFADLQLELKELEREVEHHQSQSSSAEPDDLFLPTTEGFVNSTKAEFDRFSRLIQDMKKKYEETLVYFGEDPSDSGAPSIEELFGTFAIFLQSFAVSSNYTMTMHVVEWYSAVVALPW